MSFRGVQISRSHDWNTQGARNAGGEIGSCGFTAIACKWKRVSCLAGDCFGICCVVTQNFVSVTCLGSLNLTRRPG